jgi:hypothetical protein
MLLYPGYPGYRATGGMRLIQVQGHSPLHTLGARIPEVTIILNTHPGCAENLPHRYNVVRVSNLPWDHPYVSVYEPHGSIRNPVAGVLHRYGALPRAIDALALARCWVLAQ